MNRADSTDWSHYHQLDEQFHQSVGTASCLDTAVEAYHQTLDELYGDFIPYPIEKLHTSNRATTSHWWLPSAPAHSVEEVVEVFRKHVDILHRTMFMGLARG